MDAADLKARAGVMLDAARLGGALTLEFFQSADLAVEWKGDQTEVTEADKRCETLIRETILRVFPDDTVVGEEEMSSKHSMRGKQVGDWVWWIDPIDGTRSFAHGVPLYAVLIGLEYKRESVAGVIELPALGERVHATQGGGAWWERVGKPPVQARVSACDRVEEALICTTSVDYFKKANRLKTLERLNACAGSVRGWSDAYAYALAATGRVDAALDPVMQPWDNAPFPVIFREAGGRFTSWQGEDRIDCGDGVAANGVLHVQILNLLRESSS